MIFATALFTSVPLKGELPKAVQENISSFQAHHPDLKHVHFDEAAARSFLASQFDDTVLSAFDTLNAYAAKADLFRYCVILKEGGLYSDVSWRCLKPLQFDQNKLTVFRDILNSSTWDACTAVFMAPQNHPSLQKAIELCVRNIRERRYGINPLCVTGPEVFGKAIALTCEPEDLILGEHIKVGETGWCLTQRRQAIPIVAVSQKSRHSTLEEFGIVGNNYSELWNSRRFFSDDPIDLVFTPAKLFADGFLLAKEQENEFVFAKNDSPYVLWGPYVGLPAGVYEVGLKLRSDHATAVDVDVVANDAKQAIIARHTVALAQGRFRFELSDFRHRAEIRVYAGPQIEHVVFEGLTIRRVSAGAAGRV